MRAKSRLRWLQRLFFVAGIAALGYVAYVQGDSWMFQRAKEQQLAALQQSQEEATPGVEQTSVEQARPEMNDGLIGRLEITRLGLSAIVMEGDDDHTLRHAAGHIPGTALPGEPGNIGISGHRDTFFRPLRNIRPDDVIRVTTPNGQYDYRVISTRVVTPDDVAVLKPDDSQTLTLVTCYPFYFVGSAPERFIVRAERVT